MSDFRVAVTPDWHMPRSSESGDEPNMFYAWFEIDGRTQYDATGPTMELAIFSLAHAMGRVLAESRD